MARFQFMLLGAGFIAKKWIETVKARDDCEIVGIASRSEDRAKELQRELGVTGTTLYGSWEEAVERTEAEGVLITLPQALHPEVILRALRADKHILCEKPLAVNMAGVQTVYKGMREHPDRVIMLNQNYRWRPHVQAFRKGIRERLVGPIGHIMFECRQQIRRKTVDAWREKMAEPFLLDFAIHHFDLLHYLTGDEVTRVIGLSFRPSWSWFEGGSAAAAIFTMRGGAVVNYGGTMVSLGLETPQEGLITIIGETGTLHLDGKSQVIHYGQGDPRTLPQEPIPGGEFGYCLAEFLAAVREKRQPETSVADHARSLALSLAVIESSRKGGPVDIADLLGSLN